MRIFAPLLLAAALLAAPPAAAQISLLGLTNSLVQFVLARVSVPGSFEITAEGIVEPEDGLTELAGVRIADGQGVWLEIDGVGLSWNVTRILRGELDINRLRARGVRVLRRPEPAAIDFELAEDAEPEPRSPFAWPRAPITTRIAELSLVEVEIAEGVIGAQSLAFDAIGSAWDEGNQQAVTLNLDRTDAVEGRIALEYLRDFADDTLRLDLDAREAAGGLVAELAGFPEDSASRMVIAADGPLSDWQVRLDTEAERVFTATGEAAITVGPPFGFTADLLVTPGEALDPTVTAVLAPEARLVARVDEDADGVIRIADGRLDSAELSLAADGSFARDTGTIDGTVALEARSGLADLVDGVDFMRIGFDGEISGTIDVLQASGLVSLDALSTEPVDIGTGRLEASVSRDGDRIGLDVSGLVDGLRIDRLGPDLLGRTDLVLDASVDGPALTLTRLSLDSPLLTLEASGSADTEADIAALAYDLSADDLTPIAAAYDVNAAGRFAVTGRLDGALSAPRLVGEAALADIVLDDTAWGRAAITHDVTLGQTPEGRVAVVADGSRFGAAEIATLFRLDDGTLALSDLRADALGMLAEGAISVDLDGPLATGAITARIADLEPLSRVLEMPLQGHAAGRIGLDVVDGRQDVTLDLSGAGLQGGDARLGRFRIDATLQDALGTPAFEGLIEAEDARAADFAADAIDFEGTATDLTGSPSARGRLTARGLQAPGLSVAAVAIDGSGEDLTGAPTASGELVASGIAAGDARVGTLRTTVSLSDLLVLPVGEIAARLEAIEAGGARVASLDATATLTARDGALDVAAAASAPGVTLDAGTLGALRLEARLADALADARSLDATLRLGASQLGGLSLTSATATAAGPQAALAFGVDASGTLDDDEVRLRLRGTADVADPAGARVTLATAEAQAGDFETRLRRPAQITVGPGIAVDNLDLELPGGGLRGALEQADGGLAARVDLDLPDVGPLAALAGLPFEAGSLALSGRFDTRPGRTGADATLTVRRLVLPDRPFGGEGIGVDASLGWSGTRAETTATVSGPFGDPIAVTASLPVRRGAGGVPELPPGGALGGSLRWQGRIGDLWALVPTADHVLDGDVTADLSLSGTVAAPQVGGTLELRDGIYQNLDLGTILTDLTVGSTIGADGSFALEVDAQDGSGSAVEARAQLADGAVTARITSREAILVRRDDATAAISLDIGIDGTLAALDVTGRVEIDRAEVRLVNATPPTVADLGTVRILGEPDPEARTGPGNRVALDLAIAAPGGVFVRGRGLDSEWRVDLAVGGTAAEPEVTGVVERVRGTLNLIGYPFQLTTGEIRFTGGTPIDPALDIAITRDSAGVVGGIFVTGVASDPEVSFRSTPELPEDEVMPRVLFGRSQQTLSPAQTLQLALGLATLLDGTGGVLDGVRASIGLDVLRFEDEGDGATVTVGSTVADGVFVGARQPLDGGSARVTVEIELFDGVTADTELSGEAGSSIGLNWRRDF